MLSVDEAEDIERSKRTSAQINEPVYFFQLGPFYSIEMVRRYSLGYLLSLVVCNREPS